MRSRSHLVLLPFVSICLAAVHTPATGDSENSAPRVVWERVKSLIPLPHSLKAWDKPSTNVPWEARRGHELLVLGDTLWLYGGLNISTAEPPVTTFLNDVWSSGNGTSWTRAIEHAAWSPRLNFGAVTYGEKMWVMGGSDDTESLSDVYSSTDGVNWTQVTTSAAWGKRDGHEVLVHDNLMWVLGGNTNGTFLNDVWYSSDGKDWVRATEHAAWEERAYFAAAVFNDTMWVFGGAIENTTERDVWYSDDGVAWTQATLTAPWGGRSGHAVAVYDNQLWLTGGGGLGGLAGSKEVWYSDDGTNWFAAAAPAWGGAFGHASRAFEDTLYVVGGGRYGGGFTNEVWAYTPGSGMGCGVGSSGQRAGIPFGDLCALAVVAIVLLAFGKLRRARQCVPTLLLGVLAVVPGFSWADAAPDATGTRVILERVKELLPLPIGAKVWETNAEITPWAGRAAHGTAVLGNRMWIYGGLNPTELNDVWYTQDGTTWTRAIASAAWSPRYEFGAAAFQNKMWVMGGYDATGGRNDVYSSTDGVNWAQVTTDAAWSKRYRHTSLAHDGKLWVLGGYSQGSEFNDVWSSTDGKQWTRAIENAEWADRSGLESASFQNKLWVFGGSYLNTYFRDIWYSDDGITWTEATATAPWSGRDTFSVAVYNGRLWLSGGHPGIKDLWYSDDGINWFEGELPEWDGRFNHSSHAFANKLYVLGGYTESNGYTNEVWSYESASGMGCSAGTSRPRRAVPFGDTILLTSAVLLLAVFSKRNHSTLPRLNVGID